MHACPGVDATTPCALQKQVLSSRCPDCTLERRRRRITKDLAEETERLQRIEASAPPAHTVERDEKGDDGRSLPWWAVAQPGDMTRAAEAERPRMEQHKVARSIKGAIND